MSKSNILPDLLLRPFNRRRNARKLMFHAPNSIVEGCYVPIGGIEQWITIRGENRSNPVLLFIHGGPASPYSIFSPLLRSWEQHFTIVQWDQRGAGKTFHKNGREGSGIICLDRLAQDGVEVAQHLCDRLGHDKVILIGSSVGSLIGMLMVRKRPDLFHAYVGTDQNSPDPQYLTYQLTLDAFRGAGLQKGVDLMERMGPDPSAWKREDFDRMNQYLVKTIRNVPNMIMDLILPSMLSSPDHRIADCIDIFKGMNFSLNYLFQELMTFDFDDLGTQFELPFFVFQGESDIWTPTAAAKQFFDEIDAPQKEFVLIRQAGHLACVARPDQFLEELIRRVLPLALA